MNSITKFVVGAHLLVTAAIVVAFVALIASDHPERRLPE